MTIRRADYSVIRMFSSVSAAIPVHATLTWTGTLALIALSHKQIYFVGVQFIFFAVSSLSLLIAYAIGYLFCLINPGRARLTAIMTACLLPVAFVTLSVSLASLWPAPDATQTLSGEADIDITPYLPATVGYFVAAASGLLLATWRAPRSIPPAEVPGDLS